MTTAATPGLPPAVPPGRWALTTTTGETVTDHLPAWATDNPTEHDVPPQELAARLADISHHQPFPGQTIRVYTPGNHHEHPVHEEILHGSIDCNPYARAPEPRVPVANVHLAGECWITDLDPEGLTHLATQLRAQAVLLHNQVLPALVAARRDWAAQHAPAPATP